jgi:predicted AAA+ superfamily ATPase
MDAMVEFDLQEGTIITDDLEANEEHNGKCIKFIPLWKWLFEGQFSD